MIVFYLRNGAVRHESVMRLRNKLEQLGKMKGVNQDEKGNQLNVNHAQLLVSGTF